MLTNSVKQAEEAIAQKEALLRGAIDTVNEAFVLFDPDDRLVFCNEKYCQLYAESAEAFVPGATFEAMIRYGAERGQYAEAIGQVDEWVAQRMALHRAANTSLVQRLNDGRVVRVIERRMADGHTVGFRIDITDLVRATEAAEDASRSKSQFLANMSHEIRTPMNMVLGMLALLRRSTLNARQADHAAKAEGAARSLLNLLNDILDFSKVEAGKMTLEAHPFEVETLLRDLGLVLSMNAAGKPVAVLYGLDPALPATLVGDALRLAPAQSLVDALADAAAPDAAVPSSATPSADQDDTPWRESLERLLTMLHAADMAATDAVEALRGLMPADQMDAFTSLHRAVMALDFERAERLGQSVLDGAAGASN